MNETSARAIALAAPGMVSLIGIDFHLAPVLIGCLAALLVRVPLIKMSFASLASELTFTLLAMLGAFVTIVDRNIGVGPAFWLGIGFGAAGSSIIELGKSVMGDAIKDRVQAAVNALLGLNKPPS